MTGPLRTDRDAVFDAFATHVNGGKVAAYRALGLEIVMGEREGIRFADAYDGTWYVNCHSNGGVFNLGHRHPAVVAAVRAALDEVDIGNHHLVSPYRARLASRLADTTDGALPGVVFGVGGGEANDLAIKLSRAVTGRQGIVSAQGGYHGHTGLSLAAGDPQYRDPFGTNLPGFVQVPFDDIDALSRVLDDGVAAVILEPIPATLGMPIPSPGYLAGVRRLCDERGALLILDEVQTGLGRTGTMWAYQSEGEAVPDLLTTGKGLSGGVYPITATLMTARVHAFFDDHPFVHISTFGGAELGCAAACAVLDVTDDALLARVRSLAARFAEGFADAPFDLRQRGLFMGLAFDDPGGGVDATQRLIRSGVFAIFANNDPSVVQFLPPLTITDGEADDLIATVRAALA